MCKPGVSSMMRRLLSSYALSVSIVSYSQSGKQNLQIYFFVIAFFISQKVQISFVNSFHGQISRIILRPWSPQSWPQWGESWFFRGAQNSSYYGLLLYGKQFSSLNRVFWLVSFRSGFYSTDRYYGNGPFWIFFFSRSRSRKIQTPKTQED